jgi:hypothetical protein
MRWLWPLTLVMPLLNDACDPNEDVMLGSDFGAADGSNGSAAGPSLGGSGAAGWPSAEGAGGGAAASNASDAAPDGAAGTLIIRPK